MIVLEKVSKSYGPAEAVKDLSFEVNRGATLVLFGPSGCGKSTTLELIAGLERPDRGRIYLDGKLVSSPRKLTAPHMRSVSMVFQDLALWPHMTVSQHLEFVLGPVCRSRIQRNLKADTMLQAVALRPYACCYPHQLSGGQRQRLALARALVGEPDILLLDEPLSGLDNSLRAGLLRLIRRLLAGRQATAVYVTHNWQEAAMLADKVAVMNGGRIEEIMDGTSFARELFEPCIKTEYQGMVS